jgi:hypothetical protein
MIDEPKVWSGKIVTVLQTPRASSSYLLSLIPVLVVYFSSWIPIWLMLRYTLQRRLRFLSPDVFSFSRSTVYQYYFKSVVQLIDNFHYTEKFSEGT